MRVPASGVALVTVFCWMAGCARFEPRPLDPSRSAVEFEARRLDTGGLRAFMETNLGAVSAWPLTSWTFEHLTLGALYYHPRLDLARAELLSAHAAEVTAGARPNPSVGVTPEYNFNPVSGVSPWIATVQFDLPLETAGKRGHRVRHAQQKSEAALQRLGEVAWQVRSGVRTALLDLNDATQRIQLLTQQLEVQQRVGAAMETKLAAGAVTTAEVVPARLAVARARKDVLDAREHVEESRARLAAALGVPLNSLPLSSAMAVPDVPTNRVFTSSEARRRALTSRTDVMAALAEYDAAETGLRLEIAKQYPDVHLGTGYQFDQGESKWAFGLTAEIPVLNRNQGPIAEAKARRAEAAARVLVLQARIAGDVDAALARWQSARERAALMEQLHAVQKTRAQFLRAQLDAGAAELLDLLTAELELVIDELFQWEARVQVLRALGDLEDAVQFPLSVDLSLNPRRAEP